jgi:hypothetical protein
MATTEKNALTDAAMEVSIEKMLDRAAVLAYAHGVDLDAFLALARTSYSCSMMEVYERKKKKLREAEATPETEPEAQG